MNPEPQLSNIYILGTLTEAEHSPASATAVIGDEQVIGGRILHFEQKTGNSIVVTLIYRFYL